MNKMIRGISKHDAGEKRPTDRFCQIIGEEKGEITGKKKTEKVGGQYCRGNTCQKG